MKTPILTTLMAIGMLSNANALNVDTPSAAANWIQFEDDPGDTTYYDGNSIRIRNGAVTLTMLANHKGRNSSQVIQSEFNYTKETYRTANGSP